MAAYDGTIRFDTRMDTKGFNDGISNITKSLVKVGVAIGAAFGVKIGLDAIKGIMKVSSEFHRLRVAAQLVGQTFGYTREQANSTIDELIDMGIQTDVASKSFIQFAREGLDVGLLPALARGAQDLNVFAEAGASSSEVMDRLMNGIVTLNPIILRHAGVAVDLEEAYRKMAAASGTTVAAMSTQEKRQAALIAVTEKLQGVTGLYEASQKTSAGQMASNTRIVNQLKGALGGPFENALYRLLKGWNDVLKVWTAALGPGGRLHGMMVTLGAVASWLGGLISGLAAWFGKLLGVQTGGAKQLTDSAAAMQQYSSSAGEAADAQAGLAGSTTKAGKAAKGALASFDELNVLQQETADDAAGGGDVKTPTPGSMFGDILPAEDVLGDEVKAKLAAIQGILDGFFGPLALSLAPLGETIWSGIKWAWDNVLVPMGEWTVTEAIPAFFDLLGAAAGILNEVLLALQPLAMWLWVEFLQPIGAWAGQALIDALGWLVEKLTAFGDWIGNNQKTVETIAIVLGSFAAAVWLVNAAVTVWTVISGIAATVTTAFGVAVAFLTSPIGIAILIIGALIAIIVLLVRNWDWVKETAGKVWEWIKKTWSGAAAWFQQIVLGPVSAWFKQAWEDIQAFASTAWDVVKTIWAAIGTWFKDNVTDPIKDLFKDALEWVQEKWETVFTGVTDFVKASINTVIDFINGMGSALATGLNTIIRGLNAIKITIPDWVPVYGGKTWSLTLPEVVHSRIPRLASGAVIPPNAEFLAVLGDQRAGRNIEAPENLLRQIVREELGGQQVGVSVSFEGSLGALVQALQPRIKREDFRVGRSLVVGA